LNERILIKYVFSESQINGLSKKCYGKKKKLEALLKGFKTVFTFLSGYKLAFRLAGSRLCDHGLSKKQHKKN